jgi:hypothetical protein
MSIGVSPAAAVWPAANRALYIPCVLEVPATVYKMSFVVSVQSGNYDIGIYDANWNRIVSKGSTAVPVAGIAMVDIADTALMPGVYFLALNIDNITASVIRVGPGLQTCQALGVQQQAVGAVTLPNPATPANPASSYFPIIAAHLVAVS